MVVTRSVGALLGVVLASLLGVESWLPPRSFGVSSTHTTSRSAELPAGDAASGAEIAQRAEKAARMERLARASRAAADAYEAGKRRNVLIALGSAAVGAAAFALQRSGGSDPVALLHRMEAESVTSTPSPPPFAETSPLLRAPPAALCFLPALCGLSRFKIASCYQA